VSAGAAVCVCSKIGANNYAVLSENNRERFEEIFSLFRFLALNELKLVCKLGLNYNALSCSFIMLFLSLLHSCGFTCFLVSRFVIALTKHF